MAAKKPRKKKHKADPVKSAPAKTPSVGEAAWAVHAALSGRPVAPPAAAPPGTPSLAWLTRALYALEEVHQGRRAPRPAAEFARLQELLGQAEACYLRLHTDRGEGVLWTAADLLSTAKELSVAEQDYELAANCRDLCESLKKYAAARAAAPTEGPPCPTP